MTTVKCQINKETILKICKARYEQLKVFKDEATEELIRVNKNSNRALDYLVERKKQILGMHGTDICASMFECVDYNVDLSKTNDNAGSINSQIVRYQTGISTLYMDILNCIQSKIYEIATENSIESTMIRAMDAVMKLDVDEKLEDYRLLIGSSGYEIRILYPTMFSKNNTLPGAKVAIFYHTDGCMSILSMDRIDAEGIINKLLNDEEQKVDFVAAIQR